jgi:hypothetical protein
MAFNLDGLNRTDERVGYFPYAPGIDNCGNECMMVVSHDPTASGCNPFYWTVGTHNRYGYEFYSQAEAEIIAKHAAGSWSVKSVDTDSIKIGVVHFKVISEAVNWGNAV